MKQIILLFLLAVQVAAAQNRPNILWIVCEDISPMLAVYGDSTARTPHLDAHAAESLVFNYAFACTGVCAPSRSGIITGMQPTSIGTMHMRTGKDVMSWGRRTYAAGSYTTDVNGDSIREYAAVIPEEVKCFTEYLRAAGYYCTNNQKTDYQFAAPLSAWDENGPQAHWRNRPKGTPFFSVFNINATHESKLWEHANLPLTVQAADVPVPPYLPDNQATRATVARHYSNVELMDTEFGAILQQLKDDGLLEQTIVFFYSDHGGPLPRQKRESYDSGLRVPLWARFPGAVQRGRSDRLVSLIDLGPTLLSLAGIQPPAYMEGRAFAGKYEAHQRAYIFGNGDRFDEYTDRVRIVRDERFLYVCNFIPGQTGYKDIRYRKSMEMMLEFLQWRDEGRLDEYQRKWFEPKVKEELYDCLIDPHNLHNLAEAPGHAAELQRLRNVLWQRLQARPDLGFLPESLMVEMMWPGGVQPVAATPVISMKKGKITLSCASPGASIVYRWSDNGNEKWNLQPHRRLYTGPIAPQKGKYLYVVAERIGFKTSKEQVQKY